jgi:hypothetical protein
MHIVTTGAWESATSAISDRDTKPAVVKREGKLIKREGPHDDRSKRMKRETKIEIIDLDDEEDVSMADQPRLSVSLYLPWSYISADIATTS